MEKDVLYIAQAQLRTYQRGWIRSRKGFREDVEGLAGDLLDPGLLRLVNRIAWNCAHFKSSVFKSVTVSC